MNLMFGLFKPRMSPTDLAGIFARVTLKIASADSPERVEQLKDEFIAEGASKDRLAVELAAFHSFCFWAGSAYALQKGKLAPAMFEALISAYLDHLRSLSSQNSLDEQCSQRFGLSFADFVSERLDTFCTVTVEVPPRDVLTAIVDQLCKFLTDNEPTMGLKLKIQHLYLLTEGGVYDHVAGTKLAE